MYIYNNTLIDKNEVICHLKKVLKSHRHKEILYWAIEKIPPRTRIFFTENHLEEIINNRLHISINRILKKYGEIKDNEIVYLYGRYGGKYINPKKIKNFNKRIDYLLSE